MGAFVLPSKSRYRVGVPLSLDKVARQAHGICFLVDMTCGIYSISCETDGNVYIGSSRDIESRIKNHFYELSRNRHINVHFQNAWNRYGDSSFRSRIVEEVSREHLFEREAYWINCFYPYVFNIVQPGTQRKKIELAKEKWDMFPGNAVRGIVGLRKKFKNHDRL